MTAARRARLVPGVAAAVAVVVVAVGLYVRRATETPLGVPWPPALGNWNPEVHPLALVAVALFAGAVAAVPRLLDSRVPAWAFGVAALLLTLLLRLALAAARTGTGAWDRVFDPARSFEATNEYLPALGALDPGAAFFLDRFAELVPSFPVHVAGHPPGLLLALHALGIDSPGGMAALCIGVGALSGPLAYLVGRQVLDERGARVGALLLALAPGALLYGATSADAVFLTLGLLAAWPLAARSIAARAAGALALAAGSFFAWSLLAVGAWAALVALQREGWRAALRLAVVCGVIVLAFHVAVHLATGFDPVGTIRATEEVYRAGIATLRPYWYWVLGSPTAFLLVLGLPLAWLGLRALGSGNQLAVAIFAVIGIASVLGFTKAETERIWLFLAPFVCLAAATTATARRAPRWLWGALAAQAVAYELLFDTVW